MRRVLSRAAMLGSLAGVAAAAALPDAAFADESFPERPITMIVPFDPGGAVDVVTRLLDRFAPAAFGGRHFTFQYLPGSGGALGTTAIAKAKPDGYTIGGFIFPQIVVQPLTHAGQYALGDFSYLAQTIADPHALVTLAGSSPYTDLKSFIAAAKAQPGKLTVGVPDVFDGTRFALLDLMNRAGINVVVIPLGGGNKENAGLLGKVVDAGMVNVSAAIGEKDKLNFLAVTSDAPYAGLPKTPTFKSLGFPIVAHDGRIYLGPKGIPAPILAKLRSGLKQIVDDPGFVAAARELQQPLDYLSGPALEKTVYAFEPVAKRLLASIAVTK